MTTRILAKIGGLAVAFVIGTFASAEARSGVISAETYACTSWAAAHEYTLASLRPSGGRMDKNCPIRISKSQAVDVTNEDDDGYTVVTYRGKTWWVDNERVK
jgi:hypothetical protein